MSEDVIRKQVSWTPLPCPWYLPSIRNYKFTFCHSILGYEIKTSGAFRSGWPMEFTFCVGAIAALLFFLLFPEKNIGLAATILLILAWFCHGMVLMRYRPHFDLPKRYFYRGIDRFNCHWGQFDQLLFTEIHALQIVPSGKKSHCQLVAVLQNGSRKLLIHGDYYTLLTYMIYENVKGRAVFPQEPSPCFLNAVAPIWDGAMFPLKYISPTETISESEYQPPTGVALVSSDDLATFNREYTAHGFNEAILWADAYSKGTGFKPLPLNLIITTLESWPSRLNAAGIQTSVRVEDFYECCGRSIETGCCFDGLNLTVEFDGYPVCLLCFIKVPFLNSRKINACFYCENEKLLEALKHAGLDKEK